ncbi:hypothetical protein [Actinoplanes sp. G11-F43]|uniref:hypothetical protein n=1 Tax=Actinoplanes sp. G11-F43 TaxID=3424130 RepID=UPI003D3558CE
MISAGAVVVAALVPVVLPRLLDAAARPTVPRELSIRIAESDDIPFRKVTAVIPGARPEAGEYVRLGIRNALSSIYEFYPCTVDADGTATCRNLVFGRDATETGVWEVAAVIVDDNGREKINENGAKGRDDLSGWFRESLRGFGSVTVSRG